ncbi:GTP-binding protein, partial [Williamsia sp.]|uniref:GTP-binding protein n=1 Tax=Williamsia sp. TaxID=1872085 RepID=UPI001A21ADA6
GRYVVHGVGGHISVTATRWAPDESPTTHLTVIGAGVDVDEVRAAIEATVAGDRSTDRQSMLAITRYQQQGRRAS